MHVALHNLGRDRLNENALERLEAQIQSRSEATDQGNFPGEFSVRTFQRDESCVSCSLGVVFSKVIIALGQRLITSIRTLVTNVSDAEMAK